MNMQFYKNLKRARVRMGKSQIEVAKAVGKEVMAMIT